MILVAVATIDWISRTIRLAIIGVSSKQRESLG
jgi:hypothetical protein